MISYRVDVLTVAGVKVAEITDFTRLSYSKRVNAPGIASIELEGNHVDIDDFVRNGQILIYRSFDGGLTWNNDFVGLHQYARRFTTPEGIDVFVSQSPGIMNMLFWRINAWFASTANRTKFSAVKAETIMKTLVQYNATASATTGNGRLRNGQITGISIEADSASGNVLSVNNAQANLLDSLQKIALVAGGDFDLIKTGAQAFEFRFYVGQRGTDRTSTIVFSLENGNMTEPEYVLDYKQTKTAAIAMGKGEDSNREYVVRTTSPFYASTFDVEVFVDARNVDLGNTAALNSRGDEVLQANVPDETINFKVLQVPSYKYGSHYFVGDLVTAKYKGISVTKKITGVDVSFTRQGAFENINVLLEPIPY